MKPLSLLPALPVPASPEDMLDLATLIPQLAVIRGDRGPLRSRFPAGAEDLMAKDLRKIVEPLRRAVPLVLARVRPLFLSRVDGIDIHHDAKRRPPKPPPVVAAVKAGQRAYDKAVPDSAKDRAVSDGADRVNKSNKLQIRLVLAPRLGANPFKSEPWLEGVVSGAANEAVGRLTGIPDRFFTKLEDTIAEGYMDGLRHEEIAEQINAKFVDGGEFGIAMRRAELIARDIVGTLNSRLGQERARSVGVQKYRWRTARDERVRGNPVGKYPDANPSHYAREGEVFDLDDPPEDGHPGEPDLCRCGMEFIIPESGDDGEDQSPGESTNDPNAF